MAQRQRKGTPAQGDGGNRTFYVVLGIIALGGILAIAYAVTGGGGGMGEAATEPVDVGTADVQSLYQQATPVRLGESDAPVKIVEFADYQCPGCGAFALQVKPRIMPYIQSGLAQFVYYDFPLGGSHVHSFLAARAARCAGEQELTNPAAEQAGGSYWVYQTKLYQEQASWSAEREVIDNFVNYAEQVGLDVDQFEQCLRSDRFADVVTANRLVGEQLGVRSTPTVLVNNRRVSGSYIQEMGDNLIQVLEEAEAQYQGQAGTTPAGTGGTGEAGGAAAPTEAPAGQ